MARALHRVMPPIERIKGSEYNIAPDALENQIDDFLLKKMSDEGKTLQGTMTTLCRLLYEVVSEKTFIWINIRFRL
jgi:Mg-chelatase subunit ChlI